MKKTFLHLALGLSAMLVVASEPLAAQLKVVTSTTDLYDIATAVGGTHIRASHIGEGYEDPHFVQPKPSFILRLREADVWAYVGLDLEIGWIFHRDVWGRGFATEAGEAARDHVLRTLKRPRVVAIIDPDNEPSKRVAARLGMQYEDHYTGAQLGHRNPDISVDLYYRNRDS